MDWFLSNLYPIGIIGALLFLGSFVRIWVRRPSWRIFWCGGGLMLAVGLGAAYIAYAPPGREDTKDEDKKPRPPAPLPSTALQRLRLDWNSEFDADWPVAGTLATISDIAYLPPVDAKKSYGDMGFTEFMPIVAGSMIGYVISAEDATVIAFRGTDFDEVSDWIANLGRSATDTPHGQIHAGFYDAYQSMKPQVDSLLEARKPKFIWITGHSLGGALALVCAYDLIDGEQTEINGLITFGQPMVARKSLSEYLDGLLTGRYARFVNDADIVPRVPPSHAPCGSLVWFTASGIKRSNRKLFGAGPNDVPARDGAEPVPLTDEQFRQLQAKLKAESAKSNRLPDGSPVFMAGPPLIDDHSMHLYVEKVRKLLHEQN